VGNSYLSFPLFVFCKYGIGGENMNFQDIFVFILVGIIGIGFVYVNFIFPQKLEKERKESEAKQKEENK
jgi:hypothetical protein